MAGFVTQLMPDVPLAIKATIPILTEHILQYIREFSIEDVPDLFDSEHPSDMSRLELGVNIFKPDWYSGQ